MKTERALIEIKYKQNPNIIVKIADHVWNANLYQGVGREKKCKYFKIEYFMPCGVVKLKNIDDSLTTRVAKVDDLVVACWEE